MNAFAKEIFLLDPPAKNKPDISVSWVYPNSYNIGMSGLGYQLIWWLLEQEEDTQIYRTFTDLREPGWQNSELFGFTLSWELDYANILKVLKEARLPLLASQRQGEDPLVFGGGPVLSANPEPFAEIFDFILLGDAELTIPALIAGWREARQLKSRKERLLALSKIPGIYVPGFYRHIYEDPTGPITSIEKCEDVANPQKQNYTPPDNYLAHSVILSPESSWGDMFLLELVRSCPQECRFCLASYLSRPFRQASVQTVISKVKMALEKTKRVGIVGPSVTEHANFSELAEELMKLPELKISIASIRMDTIDPLLLRMLVSLGQRSVTIALESGSERLRSIMKKNLREDEIWQGMEKIAISGIEQVKFYGMVGLPGETTEDLDETVRLISAIKKKYKNLRIILGLSSFVPKAQTPFQWAKRMPDCGQRIEHLRKRLAKLGVDLRAESHNWSDVQTLLSRADRRITPHLIELYEKSDKLGSWKKMARHKTDSYPGSDFYVFRQIPTDECLPWSHLVESSKLQILKRHLEQAEAAL